MHGKLILVSGVSGAGKTTLIAHALKIVPPSFPRRRESRTKSIPQLSYLNTFTTRPMREGEEGTHEYEFVDAATYAELKKNSTAWDHTDYKGYSYGADIAQARDVLSQGGNIICSVAPDNDVIAEMSRLYGTEVITIWIEAPMHIAAERVSNDVIRKNRNESDSAKESFNIVFSPSGVLQADEKEFAKLIQTLTQ
jgi:guanylate kinase